ncbi:MAG: MATE family efflux transporter [Firmicutes bacterium]|nr:MATE family efflux transporter [Bacillota bacterium]
MSIKLSDSFTYKKLLRFTLPSVVMMVFTSIYGVVDGFFVSNYVGATQFAAVNLIMPFLMLFGALGFMVGQGGSALVSVTLGSGDEKRANSIFSLLVYLLIAIGLLITVLGLILVHPVSKALGASDDMLPYCVTYGRILMAATVPFMLQNVFQSFFVTAERPELGLKITIAAGLVNMFLDFLLTAVIKGGVVGASLATAVSQCIGGIIPLVYFIMPNKSRLHLGRTKFSVKAVFITCTNGSSELMTNVSMSVVNMLYNYQLMKLVGENGVSAYGVIMYVSFIFIGVFLGYSIGSIPVIGYHYGAQNTNELKSLLKKSLVIVAAFSAVLTILAEVFAGALAGIFVSYDPTLFALTKRGFMLFSISYAITGFNIFASSFFTALNNGFVSALISFARTLVFQIFSVMLLPIVLGIDGIWLSIVLAESMAIVLTVSCFVLNRKKYNYF